MGGKIKIILPPQNFSEVRCEFFRANFYRYFVNDRSEDKCSVKNFSPYDAAYPCIGVGRLPRRLR